MENIEIDKILKSYHKTRKFFIGTYPSDKVPHSDRYPYATVINTDDSSHKGSHWVALYVINPNTVEYFDSFAEEPNENIAQYLSKYTKIVRSDHPLQSLFSNNCGKFVINFIIERSKGKSFEQIIQFLRKHPNREKYLDSYLKNIRKLIDSYASY